MSNAANTSCGILRRPVVTAMTVTGASGLLRRSTDPLSIPEANAYLVRPFNSDGSLSGAPCADKCVA